MTRRLLLTFLSLTAFALVIVVVPLGVTFSGRERDRAVFDLERDAQAVAALSEDDLEGGTPPDLAGVFRDYRETGARILVVDGRGRSVADSTSAALGRDYSTRQEIADALAGRRTSGRRRSSTLGTSIVYVAIPVASQGLVHGAVRITVPTSEVDQRVRDTWVRLGALSGVVLVAVGGLGLFLARSVTRPVREIEAAAARLADGDLAARAGSVGGPPEVAGLARQFDATAERLEHLVVAQRRFVADASHQLRTPLTALRLRIETLQPGGREEPGVAAALAETDRLGKLVESLLAIARSESGAPEIAAVDLAAVARERVGSWREVAVGGGVDLTLEAPDRQVARAPVGGLEQVIDNLVANALEVAPSGSEVAVRVVGRPDGGAQLTVTDQGPGMTAAERARATDRFWRAAGATGTGSGLGLAIVEELVRAAGGSVALVDAPGSTGLRVAVDLPGPTA